VIGLPNERLGEIVVVVVDLEPDIPKSFETENEIFRFCEGNLPKYKRPKRIIFYKVPRNPTGKIEKIKMKQKYVK